MFTRINVNVCDIITKRAVRGFRGLAIPCPTFDTRLRVNMVTTVEAAWDRK